MKCNVPKDCWGCAKYDECPIIEEYHTTHFPWGLVISAAIVVVLSLLGISNLLSRFGD